ncbi:hypothetical protein [Streptomyces tauricus]
MSDLIARLISPFLRFFFPTGRRRRRTPTSYTYQSVCQYSCQYVGGPTAYRTGEPPLRGEDSPLVRPYLLVPTQAPAPAPASRVGAVA